MWVMHAFPVLEQLDLQLAGWKGVGKGNSYSKEQGPGRIARWQRIAEAASKQSLRSLYFTLAALATLNSAIACFQQASFMKACFIAASMLCMMGITKSAHAVDAHNQLKT